MITHDPEQARQLADDLLFMKDGIIPAGTAMRAALPAQEPPWTAARVLYSLLAI